MFQKFKQAFIFSVHHQTNNDNSEDQNLQSSSSSLPSINSKELTPKEIQLVRQTWSILRNDLAGFKFFGAELLVRYFALYPDYQKQFKSLKDVPIDFQNKTAESIRIDKKLMAHGTYVMYTIGMLVDNLENPSVMEQMLKRLARNHYRRRVNLLAFEQLRDTLLQFLHERLGDKIFNKKTMIAWRKAFGYLLDEIESNFKILNTDIERTGSYYRLNSLQRHAKQDLIQNYQRNHLLDYQQQMRLRSRNEYLAKLRSSKIMEDVIEPKQQQTVSAYKQQTSMIIKINDKPISYESQNQNQKSEKSKNFLWKTLSTLKKSFIG